MNTWKITFAVFPCDKSDVSTNYVNINNNLSVIIEGQMQ